MLPFFAHPVSPSIMLEIPKFASFDKCSVEGFILFADSWPLPRRAAALRSSYLLLSANLRQTRRVLGFFRGPLSFGLSFRLHVQSSIGSNGCAVEHFDPRISSLLWLSQTVLWMSQGQQRLAMMLLKHQRVGLQVPRRPAHPQRLHARSLWSFH